MSKKGVSLGLVKALVSKATGADPAVIEQAVSDWLDDHPEATTTVADGSITEQKLAAAVAEKINEVSDLKSALSRNKLAYLETNCAEMLQLLCFEEKTSAGVTFTPTPDGRSVVSSGTPTGDYQYYFYNGSIDDSPFVAGQSYTLKFTAPSGAYFQVLGNNDSVIINTQSSTGTKTVTIPANTTSLKVKLYCTSSAAVGNYDISLVNNRNKDYVEETFATTAGMETAIGAAVSEVNANIDATKLGVVQSARAQNCLQLVSVMSKRVRTSGGLTFTPSSDGTSIVITGTATGEPIYYLLNETTIDNTPFVAGGKYKVAFTAPTEVYIQIVVNTRTVVLSSTSYTGIKTITIPANATTIYVRLYCASAAVAGTCTISIINERSLDYLEEGYFAGFITLETLEMFLGVKRINLLSGVETIAGKYVSYQNGSLQNLSSYSATDYFTVYPGLVYTQVGYAAGTQIAFYNKDKVYVSGLSATSSTFTIPDNSDIVFARWCSETSSMSSWGLYVQALTAASVKYVNTTEGLLEGVIDASDKGFKKIVVTPGEYDIIAEYKAKYGNSYFDDYATAYNGLVNGYNDRGIWLDNVEIVFQSGAKVLAQYVGDNLNPNVKEYFSAFAVGQNVVIDGLVLDATNLRYGIHPDFHPNGRTETFTVRNCDLHHYKPTSTGVNNNQCIGAGLGVNSTWIFENNIFRSDTDHPVLRIHNNASGDSQSKIVIKDCYIVGSGYILLNSYSTSTKQTEAIVTNCSWLTPAVVGKETESSEDNITMYAWNNETRQS